MQGISVHGTSHNLQSIETAGRAGESEAAKFSAQLDDMYNALVIEHGVATTDYSHQFKE